VATTVQFDEISNAIVQKIGLRERVLRGVTVSDIDTAVDGDPQVLMLASQAVEAQSGGGYPGRPELIYSGLFLRGIGPNSVQGYASYETTTFGAPSSYIIRNVSRVQSVETNLIPGSRIPISTKWVKWDDVNEKNVIGPDNVTMRFMMPTRGIEVSGLVYGTPTAGHEQFVGYVNNGAWGPPGKPTLPKGWWMLSEYSDTQSVYQGFYTYTAVAIARTFEDWSQCGILFNSLLGKYVDVDPADISTMNSRDYSYGMIYPVSDDEKKKGIVRVGGNKITSFPSIFGF
jgi:hypothetical protein